MPCLTNKNLPATRVWFRICVSLTIITFWLSLCGALLIWLLGLLFDTELMSDLNRLRCSFVFALIHHLVSFTAIILGLQLQRGLDKHDCRVILKELQEAAEMCPDEREKMRITLCDALCKN